MSEWLTFLGRLHPVVLHLPIGILLAVGVLEVARAAKRSERWDAAIGVLLALGAASAVLAAAMGLFLSWEGGYDERLLFWHKWLGIGVAVLSVAALALRTLHARRNKGALAAAYRATLAAAVAVLVVAGHFGGSLTHGADYLTGALPFRRVPQPVVAQQPAPPVVVAEGSEDAAAQPDSVPTIPVAASSDLAHQAYAILSTHCFRCHGPERQRSGLRLDNIEAAMAGGNSGMSAVVPGDPMFSLAVYRVTLPRDHEDAMPPRNRAGLTPEEIVTLIQWIHEGAEYP